LSRTETPRELKKPYLKGQTTMGARRVPLHYWVSSSHLIALAILAFIAEKLLQNFEITAVKLLNLATFP